ncbi:thioredoxin, mitochondrial-like [Paramacrobiotus metropolitanus]|uniref:thioredoxin, mitochondrial-like n=1 Tax=Paramacrobiotus metropolitanus TaxID=2943436 RepID=UPI002446322A|nr:thioredoxin, mitochondrial-like [Paramacrobiotus metropolitanus]
MRSLMRFRQLVRLSALQPNGKAHSVIAPSGTTLSRIPVPVLHPLSSKSFHTAQYNFAKADEKKAESPASSIFNIQDEEDFNKRVLQSETPVIVDFHATWCRPCKLLGPRLEAHVAEGKGKVNMAKVDIDALDDIACKYNVRSVPTVIAMKNGKIVEQFIGLVDDDRIKSVIEKLLH